MNEAMLGLATNEEMIRELIVRFSHNADPGDIERALILAEMVGRMSAPSREYRTALDEPKLSPVLEEVVKQIPPKKSVSLGVRNKKIKDMWAAGKTRREIADAIGVSYQTVYGVTGMNTPKKKK